MQRYAVLGMGVLVSVKEGRVSAKKIIKETK
jgi:hypothetical protein